MVRTITPIIADVAVLGALGAFAAAHYHPSDDTLVTGGDPRPIGG
jgi:hypothetical protein